MSRSVLPHATTPLMSFSPAVPPAPKAVGAMRRPAAVLKASRTVPLALGTGLPRVPVIVTVPLPLVSMPYPTLLWKLVCAPEGLVTLRGAARDAQAVLVRERLDDAGADRQRAGVDADGVAVRSGGWSRSRGST